MIHRVMPSMWKAWKCMPLAGFPVKSVSQYYNTISERYIRIEPGECDSLPVTLVHRETHTTFLCLMFFFLVELDNLGVWVLNAGNMHLLLSPDSLQGTLWNERHTKCILPHVRLEGLNTVNKSLQTESHLFYTSSASQLSTLSRCGGEDI
jgi:hypothetical protein